MERVPSLGPNTALPLKKNLESRYCLTRDIEHTTQQESDKIYMSEVQSVINDVNQIYSHKVDNDDGDNSRYKPNVKENRARGSCTEGDNVQVGREPDEEHLVKAFIDPTFRRNRSNPERYAVSPELKRKKGFRWSPMCFDAPS